MGTDISGWVEVKQYTNWEGVVHINSLAERNYDLFGMLFGIMNFTDLVPIAAARGLPEDASNDVLHEVRNDLECSRDEPIVFNDWLFGPTWITEEELRTLDRAEAALDHRARQYTRRPDGTLNLVTKSEVASDLQGIDLAAGQTVEVNDSIYQLEHITRGEILENPGAGWQIVFDMMTRLATEFGAAHVRLTVWFDR